ncbi:MAG: hypothetical protein ACRDHF_03050 [Tepidiformaceae bacterium]
MKLTIKDFDFEDAALLGFEYDVVRGSCSLDAECWSIPNEERVPVRMTVDGVFTLNSYSEVPFDARQSLIHDFVEDRSQAAELYSKLVERGRYKVLQFTIAGRERSVDLADIDSERDVVFLLMDAVGLHLAVAGRSCSVTLR